MIGKDIRFLDIFFALWILSVPFYQIGLVGTLSADNLLTILVLITWTFTAPFSVGDKSRIISISIVLVLIFIHVLIIMITFTTRGTLNEFFSVLSTELKFKSYFLVPLLCISNHSQYIRALVLLSVDGLMISSAAFLQATGLLNLSFSRSVAGDRLGIEGISRSPGLFANYGDIAILLTMTLLVVVFLYPRLRFGRSVLLRYPFISLIVLGVIASQSRNVMLSVLIGFSTYWFFIQIMLNRAKVRGIKLLFLIPFGICALLAFYYSLPAIMEVIVGSGGIRGSVLDRIEQYQIAFKLISDGPVLGMSAEHQIRHNEFINSVHNLWLIYMLKGGILTVLPLLGLIWMSLRWAIRPISSDGSDWSIRVGATVASMTMVIFASSMVYVAHSSILFWITFGILVGYGALRSSRT